MIEFEIKGIKEIASKLKKVDADLSEGIKEVLRKAGEMGWFYAQSLAPVEYGYLREAIINFPEGDETWIIMSSPPADHPDFPLNVYIDEGMLGALNWGSRTEPKTGEFGFMDKTFKKLQEVADEMNIMVERCLR